MIPVDWEALGLTTEQGAVLGAVSRGSEHFEVGLELAIWQQWVGELERGRLWTRDELHAAWGSRDDLDLTLRILSEEWLQVVLSLLDDLDRTFRDLTVGSPADPERWWVGRVPLRSRQRLYLFGRIQERPDGRG